MDRGFIPMARNCLRRGAPGYGRADISQQNCTRDKAFVRLIGTWGTDGEFDHENAIGEGPGYVV